MHQTRIERLLVSALGWPLYAIGSIVLFGLTTLIFAIRFLFWFKNGFTPDWDLIWLGFMPPFTDMWGLNQIISLIYTAEAEFLAIAIGGLLAGIGKGLLLSVELPPDPQGRQT